MGGFCEIGESTFQPSISSELSPNDVTRSHVTSPLSKTETKSYAPGETLEEAVIREVKEETGAVPYNLRLLGVYSDPDRDDRRHTVSATYIASITGKVRPGDDAKEVAVIPLKALDVDRIRLAFDHNHFLQDYAKATLDAKFEGSPREGTSLCPAAGRWGNGDGGGMMDG